MSASDLGGPSSPQGGMEFIWPSEVSIEDILAAADRRARYLAGEEIPGRRKRKSRSSGRRTGAAGNTVPPSADTGPAETGPAETGPADAGPAETGPAETGPADTGPADAGAADPAAGAPSFDPAVDDPQGEDAVEAAMSGAGSSVPLADLAGHALIDPGPALAGWLSCAPSADLDDAGLVTSITAWRKVTSWAQSQELAAVAELAGRRGRGREAASGKDRVQKLEAEFAPSEVALALTLTECGAEYWMDLAVSMTRRLPATVAALHAGRIDLARAKLIEAFTVGLDDELAGQIERRVLGRAEHQTTGQLRASLQRAVIAADPAAAERRREEAERNARVELSGDPEGTGSLAGRFLPAGHAAAAWSRICAMAKALESSGAGGGIDLLRAQVFVGLLLGTLPIIPPPLDERGDGGPGDEGNPGSGGSPDHGDDPRDDGPGNGRGPGHGGGPEEGNGPGHCPAPGDGDRPGHQNARADVDDLDKADGRDLAGDIPGAGTPECRVRAGPAGSSWPEIPVPGSTPAPGCAPAPDWLGGIPPPGAVTGSTQAADDQSGRSKAGRKQTGRSIPAGAMTLTVPLRTLAGLAGEPGQLGRLGAVTGEVARKLAAAAAANPACEWKIILIGTAGEAIAITRLDKRQKARCGIGLDELRGPGWIARIILTVSTADLASGALSGPEELPGSTVLRKLLNVALEAAAKTALAAARADLDASPAAGGSPAGCGHPGAVSSYRIPGSMRRLIEARDQTCRSPVCRQPAWRTDMDHTIPYDLGGPTCRCNVSAECRHHHRLKQLKGWQLRQPQPGVLVWVTPARLTYTVEPDPYPV